jgi:hypothetical protein
LKPNKDYAKQVKELSDYFNEAKSYNKGDKVENHLPFAALAGVFDGSKRLYIKADDEKSITEAVNFAKSQDVSKLTIVGGYQAGHLGSFLKQNDVSVFLRRVHTRPELEDDDYDYTFKHSRNLPFYAGTTVAHGLTKEQALQLITQNPAKILGIDTMYGTLEVGKSATLFISEGDALDMRTNILTHAFIDGRSLSLETHQTELWKRYSQKYNEQD